MKSGPIEANHEIQHQYPRNVRFCPLCGGELASRIVLPDHREHKVCARCGFVYFQGPKMVAGSLVIENQRVLLLRRGIQPSLGKWTFPGGYVDLGETPSDCALRETAEEVGMNVTLGQLLGVYADRKNPNAIVVAYLAEPGSESPGLSLEATEVRYFGSDEIPWDELAFHTTYQALVDWVAELKDNTARGGALV